MTDGGANIESRDYDPKRDREAIQRLWRGIGWVREGQESAAEVFLSCGRKLVADVDGEAECVVGSMPGTISYQGEELPLSAVTTVSTSRRVRKRGLARRLTAQLVAADAAEGALVAGLGMFEQGFYDQLGFGTGTYENWVSFDPAQLKVGNPCRVPRRITAADWEMVHASRLKRMRAHGSCNLLPPEVTRAAMMGASGGFGFGYCNSEGELTHHFWCSTTEPGRGPYHVYWMSYRTWDQFLELVGLYGSLGDQVRLIRMREPPGIQFQDLLHEPFRRRGIAEDGKYETGIRAHAYWQMRICDLRGCLAHTRLRGGQVRFNLELTDPIEGSLEELTPWRGIAGSYVVTLGPSSGAELGTDKSLPTLRVSVGAFTRMWLGVRPPSSLAVTDRLIAPEALLLALEELLCLPPPKWDWDF